MNDIVLTLLSKIFYFLKLVMNQIFSLMSDSISFYVIIIIYF
jgi:hypothetical protein